MKTSLGKLWIIRCLLLLLAHCTAAGGAEIKVLSTMAVRSVMEQILPEFKSATGHTVSIAYETSNLMAERIRNGESADLAILTPALIDALAKQGSIVRGSNVALASSGVGVAVCAGTPKPDIRNSEELKRVLLNARSIAYTSSGQSGAYFAGLIEKLGIADQVKAKAKIPAGGSTGELVVKGEAEMAVQQMSELLATPGLVVVALPPEVQFRTMFSAGVCSSAKEAQAAEALIKFLLTPTAARVIKAKGMEPAAGLQ